MSGAVLVARGAGDIGSHNNRQLRHAGYRLTVLENIYSGRRSAVEPEADFVEEDISEKALLPGVMRAANIDAVVRFAGHCPAPESVLDPLQHYGNNRIRLQSVIKARRQSGVARLILSSGGSSVRDEMRMVHPVGGTDFPISDATRCAGQHAELVADDRRISRLLECSPRHDDLDTNCRMAWEWGLELGRPVGQVA